MMLCHFYHKWMKVHDAVITGWVMPHAATPVGNRSFQTGANPPYVLSSIRTLPSFSTSFRALRLYHPALLATLVWDGNGPSMHTMQHSCWNGLMNKLQCFFRVSNEYFVFVAVLSREMLYPKTSLTLNLEYLVVLLLFILCIRNISIFLHNLSISNGFPLGKRAEGQNGIEMAMERITVWFYN